VGGGTFVKNLRMPSFLVNCRLVSSSDGTEESSEDSSELMLVVVRWLLVVWCCHFWKDEVRGSFEHLPTQHDDRKVHWSTLTDFIMHVQPRMARKMAEEVSSEFFLAEQIV
jgi:hypothetical protein